MRSFAWIFAPLALALVMTGPILREADAKPKAAKALVNDGAALGRAELRPKPHAKAEKAPKAPKEKPPKGPLSAGAPNAGKLHGSEKLTSNRSLEVRGGAHAYGVPDLVRVLKRAASKVNKKHKGSVLFVGDLSAKKGGALFGHNSHQSGRDADVGFYMRSEEGKHVNPHRFVTFGGDGKARGGELVRFDDERNWAFVEALLTDEKTDVRYLFVSMGLRTRLLKYAAKKNVPKELYTKAASVLMSPADADVHDDHFHVRIACPEKMRPQCVEESYLRPGQGNAPQASKDDAAPKAEAKDAAPKEVATKEEAPKAEPAPTPPAPSAPTE